MEKPKFEHITPEIVAKAISEYMRVHHDQTVLKLKWCIDVDMTDQTEPTPYGKFMGVDLDMV